MCKFDLLVHILLIITCTVAQEYSKCETKIKCSDCIQQVDCVWCTKAVDNVNNIHCVANTSDLAGKCPRGELMRAESVQTITSNIPIKSVGSTVQLSPQKIRLQIGRGQKHTINFQYAHARNYPIDLYYIMDLSASMLPHKNKLATLGTKLARAMRNITTNFRLGFGSFVDKVELPFVNIEPSHLKNPCRNGCAPPYSFINHMQLSEDYKQFEDEVRRARVSGNLDAPEGGFDALMQAIVCRDEIGWRPKSRHLVVFSTDASFHIAGDGKLAGIVEPNDAKCHMRNHSYTAFLQYDYPSISHINHVITENNINIIFAIVNDKDIHTSYKKLTEQIRTASFGILEDKSENVINLVLENYNKIVTSVTMKANTTADIDVQIQSSCPNPIPGGCTKIHVADEVDFQATIQPLKCHKSRADNVHKILIQPNGVDEVLEVEVDVQCNCPCEGSNNNVNVNPACSNQGSLECGVCNCVYGRFGDNCQCDINTSTSTNTSLCRKTQLEDICSGVGKCKCSICECNRRQNPKELIYGKYCECNNYSCPKSNGLLCSGNGICDCGVCNCGAGWSGDTCDCSTNQEECTAPDGKGQLCSGNGNCSCGRCECSFDKEGKNRFSGKHCEECPTCPPKKCDELKECVICQVQNGDGCPECNSTVINLVENLPTDLDPNEKQCRWTDEKDCVILYRYNYDENQELVVYAQNNIVCPEPPNILAWVMAVVGSIVVIGLLTLIVWRVLTEIYDRREYAKFENEKARSNWARQENPLYRKATTTHQNLAYTGQ